MKKTRTILCAYIALFTSICSTQLQQATASDADWENYQSNVLSHQTNIPGWCSLEKAKSMMDLIFEVRPKICVEVGVFGGSSIYPTASALKFLDQGVVYAIDPWSAPDCLKGYTPDNPNYQWWNSIDLERIYLDFLKMLNCFQLSPYCVVMRTTGLNAIDQFTDESIDILHIDGNHTEEMALNDAKLYLPKVKKGGYIWFDDVNWATTKSAWEFLSLYCVKDETRSTNEYFLFRKI